MAWYPHRQQKHDESRAREEGDRDEGHRGATRGEALLKLPFFRAHCFYYKKSIIINILKKDILTGKLNLNDWKEADYQNSMLYIENCLKKISNNQQIDFMTDLFEEFYDLRDKSYAVCHMPGSPLNAEKNIKYNL